MRTSRIWQPTDPGKNGMRDRFRILPFTNATGSQSWRVTGIKRDGQRVRENFSDLTAAECRKVELQTEWLARQTDTAVRATKLTDTQLRLAEAAYIRLDADHEMMLAVDYWLKHGRQNAVAESPRLDEAVKDFCKWLETPEAGLRPLSRDNLRRRVNVFCNSLPNLRVSDVTPDTIDGFLATRDVSGTAKDNDRRAASRFFAWCIERPRRWTTANPCREIRVNRGEKPPPAILTLEQAEKLLRSAEAHKDGQLVPYTAVCLFAGLRPWEAQRLEWSQVNLNDKEIRLEAIQTKTGKPRVVSICPTLHAWLTAHKDKPFYPENWRRDFDAVKSAIGYGRRTTKKPDLARWTPDILRHTAISFYFRKTGSYGQTAEQFGNSEAIIKAHYQGRVSSEDAKNFYNLKPKYLRKRKSLAK